MTTRADSASEARQAHQPEDGGSLPTSALFRKADWIVAPARLEVAQKMVEAEHYSHGGSNTAVYVHGLFPRGYFWERECVGVAWWIPPTKSAAKAAYPVRWGGGIGVVSAGGAAGSAVECVLVPDSSFDETD